MTSGRINGRDGNESRSIDPLVVTEPGMGADIILIAPAIQSRRPPAKHAVQFVDEKVYGLVGILRGDRSLQIGAPDFDVSLGGEQPSASTVRAFDVDTKSEDPRFVTKQSLRFGFDSRSGRVGEIKVNTTKDELRTDCGQNRRNHVLETLRILCDAEEWLTRPCCSMQYQ